ncbi:unnamed protein product [Phyllotreta striolata]|uniref:SH3 domain-binding glutamic acid-rich-like protein n=1 Tax=Phyllotreta striolata TaxID=444603 RepID=A0A9N9XQ47_PHYSR|nr:unnamed protein product [Phyllotreta striolata]
MVIEVYISLICGNTEIKSRQQRILSILDSKSIKYKIVDISGENNEESKRFMHENATEKGGTMSDPDPKFPLPPQFFNDGSYCGDYNSFDEANELGELKKFLRIEDKAFVEMETGMANKEIEVE